MERIGHQRAMTPQVEPRKKAIQDSAFDQESESASPMQLLANASAQVSQLRSMQSAANAFVQRQASTAVVQKAASQGPSSASGLPDSLKSGIENLSGMAMDDVKVHYNSSQPAQMQAHAFAQGSEIHVAPGQEQHLAHEAWHVVQQKQGRVQATTQLKGVGINDDTSLETEADVMGAKAQELGRQNLQHANLQSASANTGQAQLKSAPIPKLHAPAQRRRRDPQHGTYVNSTTEDVWIKAEGADGAATSRKGHLFTHNLGNHASKAELIKAITDMAGSEGAIANLYSWVTRDQDYNKPAIANADAFRLRLHGTYTGANTPFSVDVHYGGYHHGYIVHVTDDAADGEIADRDRSTDGAGVPLADFSSTHHNRGNNNLFADTNHAGGNARDRERKLDASTKLIGEGARFQAVANHQANLTDSTKFFIRRDANNHALRWITFDQLWLTWSMTFGKGFNIADERIKTHLVADDFRKISEPQAIAATNGVPGNITVGRDYSVDDERAAEAKDLQRWHLVQFTLPPEVGVVNGGKRTAALQDLRALAGVISADASASGKTYTVRAYEAVDEAAMRAAMPNWSRPVVAPVEEPVQDEAEPVHEDVVAQQPVVAQPEGVVEADFNKALNKRFRTRGLPESKPLKAEIRKAAKEGKANGLTFHGATARFVVGASTTLDDAIDWLIDNTEVVVEEEEAAVAAPSKKSASDQKSGLDVKGHESGENLQLATRKIKESGGKKKGNGYVLTILFVLMLIAFLLGWVFMGSNDSSKKPLS